jgi:hypothetical protein
VVAVIVGVQVPDSKICGLSDPVESHVSNLFAAPLRSIKTVVPDIVALILLLDWSYHVADATDPSALPSKQITQPRFQNVSPWT